MKLSSRKKLLSESEDILRSIRKEIQSSYSKKTKINESFFDDFINSILSMITNQYRKKRQSYYYKQIPYLIGVDLISNQNLKIDKKYLDNLEKMTRKIMKDIMSSPHLNEAIKDLENQSKKISDYRLILRAPYLYSDKKNEKFLQKMKKSYNKAIEDYNTILFKRIKNIIEDILKRDEYKDFSEMVMSNITLGISGLSKKEISLVQNNYLKVVTNRAANYIDKNKVKHALTPLEEPLPNA